VRGSRAGARARRCVDLGDPLHVTSFTAEITGTTWGSSSSSSPAAKVLLRDVRAAPKHDVFAAGGLSCLVERGLDSVSDEVEPGPSLHLRGITQVMGEDEDGVVVGRVVAPPARRTNRLRRLAQTASWIHADELTDLIRSLG
jgi:hypothetical protein